MKRRAYRIAQLESFRRYFPIAAVGITIFFLFAAFGKVVFLSFMAPNDATPLAGAPRPTAIAAGTQGTAPSVSVIRQATGQVYRLIVDVDGAAKGGTGFLVSGKRIIATNYHVVERGVAFTLGFMGADHRVQRVPLRLLAVYPQKDLALLQTLDDLPGDPLPLFTSDADPATDLFAIGFPAAADPPGTNSGSSGNDATLFVPSVLRGSVSRVLPNRWYSSQLQHQTPITPGYSGGPLLDSSGVVIGISSSIHKEAAGISYAVLASDLADFVMACGFQMNGSPSPADERQAIMSAPATVASSSLQSAPNTQTDMDRAMMERANRMLTTGDIAAARLVLEYLKINTRSPQAVATLAKSYDPFFLKQKNVLGVTGDAAKAAELYREAAELGDEEAKHLLTAITKGRCSGSTCRLVNSDQGPKILCGRSLQ